jgi:sterol 14-demethylase
VRRIVVDRDLCQGHGVCESEAPDVFAVSKKGELTVLVEQPPAAQWAALDAAVKYCPTHALSIVDEGTS